MSGLDGRPLQGCPTCGGPVRVANYAEATITEGACGYVYAAHFGGGEADTEPCRGTIPARTASFVIDSPEATRLPHDPAIVRGRFERAFRILGLTWRAG